MNWLSSKIDSLSNFVHEKHITMLWLFAVLLIKMYKNSTVIFNFKNSLPAFVWYECFKIIQSHELERRFAPDNLCETILKFVKVFGHYHGHTQKN